MREWKRTCVRAMWAVRATTSPRAAAPPGPYIHGESESQLRRKAVLLHPYVRALPPPLFFFFIVIPRDRGLTPNQFSFPWKIQLRYVSPPPPRPKQYCVKTFQLISQQQLAAPCVEKALPRGLRAPSFTSDFCIILLLDRLPLPPPLPGTCPSLRNTKKNLREGGGRIIPTHQ